MNRETVAAYWTNCGCKESKAVKCLLCPNNCTIADGQSGVCGVRSNKDGKLIAASYGYITSIALDPIEKKPLYEYCSGSKVLSVGSLGCNFHCPFCQNYTISMEYGNVDAVLYEPDTLVDIAKRFVPEGNIGLAYTYNEPLIGYEYVLAVSKQIKAAGLKNILVTNGYINPEPFDELLPYIDAVNIDIKGGASRTYKTVGGTLESVIEIVKRAKTACHVELTTLIIPGENDADIEQLAQLIASIDREIPYHLSRFFPKYKYNRHEITPKQTLYRCKEIAEQYLGNVYLGNI